MKILCVFGLHAYGDPARGESYEHANFLPTFVALGHQVELFDSFDREQYGDFADLNLRLLDHVQAFEPDVIFCTLMGYEVWLETLDLIRSRTPAVVVNWGTDDSWKFRQFIRYLTEHVDIHVTTHSPILAEAKKLGINNILSSQWAVASSRLAEPTASHSCTYDVSFVGAAYGNRRAQIGELRRRGITVTCFGYGWESGAVDLHQVDRIFCESRISLNFADSGLQLSGISLVRSRQVKARTFEVPGSGGFLLSEESESLSAYFRIGAEIVTYRSRDDLVQKIRYFLDHPAERDAIAEAGHQRARREHTYEARFLPMLLQAKKISDTRRHRGFTLSREPLMDVVAKHRNEIILSRFLNVVRSAAGDRVGPRKFLRALRRLAYELSWRICGDRTFRAAGLPGRLFFRES